VSREDRGVRRPASAARYINRRAPTDAHVSAISNGPPTNATIRHSTTQTFTARPPVAAPAPRHGAGTPGTGLRGIPAIPGVVELLYADER
jgi:hypothetical protein